MWVEGIWFSFALSPVAVQSCYQLGIVMKVGYNPGGGGVHPYMGYIGTCHCEGYGFQAVYSSIGYHFSGN